MTNGKFITIWYHAWLLVWSRPSVWVIGVFATILASGTENDIWLQLIRPGALTSFSLSNSILSTVWASILNIPGSLLLLASQPGNAVMTILVTLFLLAIILFFFWLGVVGQAGLLIGIQSMPGKSRAPWLKWFNLGRRYFWSVGTVALISRIIILLLVGVSLINFRNHCGH